MPEIRMPFETFRDVDGTPLEGGYIYIGTANQEPITNPISVYWDAALTVPAAQPIRTIGGIPANSGAPSSIYCVSDYSITVKNKGGEIVVSALSAAALNAGMVIYNDATTYPSGSVGFWLNKLKDTASALYGAGMIGYNYARAYVAGTLGYAVKALTDRMDTAEASIAHICEGRLTLQSGVPVSTTDQLAKTTIYFTPYKGNRIALYVGGKWVVKEFSELSIDVPPYAASLADIFVRDNNGTPVLEIGAGWSTSSARASALTVRDGVLALASSEGWRYVGTYGSTAVAGQCEDSEAKRLLWNYYNRVPRPVRITDATVSWTYSSITTRQANGNTANQIETITGWGEDPVSLRLTGGFSHSAAAAANIATMSIGFDSTTSKWPYQQFVSNFASTVGGVMPLRSDLSGFLPMGRHTLTWLEVSTATATFTFYGGSVNGISGQVWG